jgi:hypothetical protein
LPLVYLPGVPAVGARLYRAVASRRHRGACPLAPTASRQKTRVTEKVEARATRQHE